MYQGYKDKTLPEIINLLAAELRADARDYIKTHTLKHLAMSSTLHQYSGAEFQLQIALRDAKVQDWVCQCYDYSKSHICVHLAAATILLNDLSSHKKSRSHRSSIKTDLATIDPAQLLQIVERLASRDEQLTTILAVLSKLSADTYDVAGLERILTDAYRAAKIGKSTRLLQRQMMHAEWLEQITREHLLSTTPAMLWTICSHLIPHMTRLRQRLASAKSRKLETSWHELAEMIATMEMAPMLRDQVMLDIHEIAHSDSYDYLGEYSLMRQLLDQQEDVKGLASKVISVKNKRAYLLADYMFLLELIEASKEEIGSYLHQLPAALPLEPIYDEALKQHNHRVLKLLHDHTRSQTTLATKIKDLMILHLAELHKMPKLAQSMTKLPWYHELLQADRSSLDPAESQRSLSLRIKLWEHERDQDAILQALRESIDIQALYVLDQKTWNSAELIDAVQDLVMRYLSRHAGLKPVQQFHQLLRHLEKMDLASVAMDLRDMAAERFPDKIK